MPDDIEQPPRGYNTDDVKALPDEEPKPRRRRLFGWRTLLIALVVIPVIVFALWTWGALSWSYSDGDRPGWIQKISRKGWLCKTWEGDLAQSPSVPGASVPTVWKFSVRDDSVAAQINAAVGKRVSLHYEEHKGIPTSCFGETDYFVTGVRVLE